MLQQRDTYVIWQWFLLTQPLGWIHSCGGDGFLLVTYRGDFSIRVDIAGEVVTERRAYQFTCWALHAYCSTAYTVIGEEIPRGSELKPDWAGIVDGNQN